MVLAEELRQAVLQAALQGKLTEQLDTDSNVDEMLEKIQEEKEQLIADKKIKKEKNPHEIEEENIPFNIPDNWRWVRLGDILRVSSGDGLTSKNMIEGSIPVYGGNGINGYHNKYNVDKATLTIGRVGANCGAVHITEGKAWITDNAFRVSFLMKQVNIFYWAIILRTLDLGNKSKATAQPVISGKTIYPVLSPFPPIEEQQRIVDKINEIMPKIDEYEKIEKELEALKKEFPTNMKDALLQAAMQGKLTEQLQNDNSVDELLISIQKEKEELIAQKKIKKEKSLPNIDEEEIPFDIPENWRWVRWGNLAYSIQYGYNAPAQEAGKIKMVRISDIQDNSVNWDSVPYCDIEDEEIETYLLQDNDILFARTGGTVGKSFLVNGISENAIYAGYLIRTRYSDQLVPKYLKLFMESQLYWVQLQNGKTQGCQPNCNGQTLSKMVIPLPPIEEQQRIVERLNALLPLCEDLKEE